MEADIAPIDDDFSGWKIIQHKIFRTAKSSNHSLENSNTPLSEAQIDHCDHWTVQIIP